MPANGLFTLTDSGKLAIRDSGKADICDDCCDGVGDDCTHCDTGTTPAAVSLEFSGLVICPLLSDCMPGCGLSEFYKYSELVGQFDPNLTVEISQSLNPCRYGLFVIDTITVPKYSDSGCTTTTSDTDFEVSVSFQWFADEMIVQLIYTSGPGSATRFEFFYGEFSATTPFDCINHLPKTVDNQLRSGVANCGDCNGLGALATTDDSAGTCLVTAA